MRTRQTDSANDMKVLLISNGRPEQTVGELFAKLNNSLASIGNSQLFFHHMRPGIWKKLFARIGSTPRLLACLFCCDVVIIHTAAAFSFPEIVLARLLRRKVVVICWDIYPHSSRFLAKRSNISMVIFGLFENISMRLSNQVLVPNRDYLVHPALCSLKNLGVFPIWPAFEEVRPIVEKQPSNCRKDEPLLKLAFCGQINSIRDLDGALTSLVKPFPGKVEFHVFSNDKVDDRTRRVARTHDIEIIENGFVSGEALLDLLATMNAGLVSISPDFELPSSPSKTFKYLEAGLPIINHGNPDSDFSRKIEEWKIGVSLSNTAEGEGFLRLEEIRLRLQYQREAFLKSVKLDLEKLRFLIS